MRQAIRGMVLLLSCSLIGCVVGEPEDDTVEDPGPDDGGDEADGAPALQIMEGQPDIVIAPQSADDAGTFLIAASTTTATSTTTVNLLSDAGFETNGPWIYRTGSKRVTSESYKGSWSLRTIGQGGDKVIARQSVHATPGMLYTLTLHQKVVKPVAQGQFGSIISFDFRDANGARIAFGGGMGYNNTDNYPDDGWTWGKVLLRKAPAGTEYVRVFISSPDPTDAESMSFWDNILLEGEMCKPAYTVCKQTQDVTAVDSCFKCCSGSHLAGDLYFCN